ncbi:ABC transporter ATP-binding protein [Paenibacillus sp. HJGM_3]|uniref:ABC transporter ATP-binding protein n=1 Tax=Paenibacillus sp. HJGM_3 TaxID=3379816 RepID=UPI00385DBDD5
MMIRTMHLTKHYDDRIGCSDITLSIEPGTCFGLLGPNGAGKSTFVKMLVGLLRPTAGEAYIHGFPAGEVEARRALGYLPELFRYPDWLTATEVLRFHARLSGIGARESRSARMTARIREVLNVVGLEGRAHERIKQFSKGMQQRLGIANAILMDPDLVLLDEPSSALDPIGRYEVRTIVRKLREAGKTIFLNTHLLEDVESVCDQVALLYNGELKATGPLDAFLRAQDSWELHVGGIDETLLDTVTSSARFPGFGAKLIRAAADGSAILHVTAGSREQIGWLNGRLVEAGATLYEVRPLNGRLEDWFLAMVDRKKEAEV